MPEIKQEWKYNEHDHVHCWEQAMNPACGQKIKHFECCLCKKVNPEMYERGYEIGRKHGAADGHILGVETATTIWEKKLSHIRKTALDEIVGVVEEYKKTLVGKGGHGPCCVCRDCKNHFDDCTCTEIRTATDIINNIAKLR